MSVPAYGSYRDSGVEWLGQAPSHWELKSLRHGIERIESGTSVNATDTPAAEGEIGVLKTSCVYSGTFRPAENKAVVPEELDRVSCPVQVGTLIVSRMNTPELVGAVGLVGEPCPNIYLPDRLWQVYLTSLLPAFVYYWAQSPSYRAQVKVASAGTSASMHNLGQDQFRGFLLAWPTKVEQRAIAAFLDREIAKIDALVESQRRLIELLKEKRQAIIAHAVTKGLDSSAPMKDSGVEWLGQVPAHWEVSQSRRMFGVRSEPALPDDQMLTASQKYGVLFQADFVEREGRRVVEVIMGKDSLRHVEPDDFIISMRSFQGGLEWSLLRGSTSFHYVMVTPIKWVHPPFFAHLFKSTSYIQALRATTDLIRDGQEIRYSHFVKVPLPVIPIEEQKRIAEVLGAELGRYDALLVEAEGHITLLQERRAALISAAVTGKIDVRGLVQTAEAA